MEKELQSKKADQKSKAKNSKAIKLKTVFMGTSHLAKNILEALAENKYNIVGCFTQTDKKSGRDKEIKTNPVKEFCLKNNIKVFQPDKFDSEAISSVKSLNPDLIIVAAYGRILPESVLNMPGFGAVNVHPSLLPRFRGSSPIQNALLLGEKETGVTIMLMDKGMDTGDILAQEKIAIDDADTSIVLTEKLTVLAKELLIKTLPLWIERKIDPVKQDNSKAISNQLIEREDGHIFWEDEAENIYNRWRAFQPWPGIFGFWESNGILQRIKFLKIKFQKTDPEAKHNIGEVFELGDQIGVQTIKGVIILEELQLEGKSPAPIKDFANGYKNFVSSILK
jgi:methionyl-tRNA formyltransferase